MDSRLFLRRSLPLIALLLNACSSTIQKSTVVLEYADFGPQVMAYDMLGPKVLPWEPATPLLIGQGQVKVVVYKDISLQEVQEHFPADRVNHTDYRFIQYWDAINYLDAKIAQNILVKVTKRLVDTRQHIVVQLPE